MSRLKMTRLRIRRKLEVQIRRRIEGNKLSVWSWVAHIEIGNLLIALSTTGLMALGVLPLSFGVMVSFAIVLFIVGVAGRYVDSVQDDVERLMVYEQNLTKGNGSISDSCSVSSPVGIKSTQQQEIRD